MKSHVPGRIRALQASASADGHFTILAADHRDAMRVMVNPAAPDEVSAETLTGIKLDLVKYLAPLASAVLLDPLYGAAQAITCSTLPGNTGLLCSLEEQGYLGDPAARQTSLLVGWSVEKSKRLGATGVKILLFYHPDSTAADAQDDFVRAVLRECARYELPLFLEPLSYPLDSRVAKSSPEFAADRRRIVVESVRRLGALGPDVLKVEFPVDAKLESDQGAWADACAELNEASPAPWALLSADEPFDTFKQQVRVACENGSSGFLAGRSVWREAASLTGSDRIQFLQTTARARLKELADIVTAYGKPWHTRYAMQEVNKDWYLEY